MMEISDVFYDANADISEISLLTRRIKLRSMTGDYETVV